MISKKFYSDNCSGVHQKVLEFITAENKDNTWSYGDDPCTNNAILKFKKIFGDNIEVFFVLNGTSANVLSLKAMANSYNSVLCSDKAHLNIDECGATEHVIGCSIHPIATNDGKITVNTIKKQLTDFGNKHRNQPKIVSISQPTELGTVYTAAEIKSIADISHQYGLFLHMDGARLFNAASSLNVSLKEITTDAKVDILSCGGAKNGLMFGESVVFLNQLLSSDFQYIQKQGLQLTPKMRFISAQFTALLSDDLWIKNAEHANKMALLLARKISEVPSVKITQKVETNMIFADAPSRLIESLLKVYSFQAYKKGEFTYQVRWVTSFNTTETDIYQFINEIKHTNSRNHNI